MPHRHGKPAQLCIGHVSLQGRCFAKEPWEHRLARGIACVLRAMHTHNSLVPKSLDESLLGRIIMKHGEDSKYSTTKQRETARPYLSRRTVLSLAGVFGVATPFAMVGASRALTAMKSGPLPEELPLCGAAVTGERL